MDKVGFIPGREARDKPLKAFLIHHWLTETDTKGFFLSMYAEKAFDSMAWDYMFAILSHLGILDLFCSKLKLL